MPDSCVTWDAGLRNVAHRYEVTMDWSNIRRFAHDPTPVPIAKVVDPHAAEKVALLKNPALALIPPQKRAKRGAKKANRKTGDCNICHEEVAGGKGWVIKFDTGWRLFCSRCLRWAEGAAKLGWTDEDKFGKPGEMERWLRGRELGLPADHQLAEGDDLLEAVKQRLLDQLHAAGLKV